MQGQVVGWKAGAAEGQASGHSVSGGEGCRWQWAAAVLISAATF